MDPNIKGEPIMDSKTESTLLKPLYLKLWHNVLSVFLGWSAEMIDQWSDKWEDGLNNKKYGGLFYHDTAVSYVVQLLIPDALWERLSTRERSQLRARIERAIEQGNSMLMLVPSYDWEAAKLRVETILSQYGEYLPTFLENSP